MHANSGGRGGRCSRRCCTTHQRAGNVKTFMFAFVFDWWLCAVFFIFVAQVAAEIAAKRAANKPSAQLKLFGTK
jgi:hypothetical protein